MKKIKSGIAVIISVLIVMLSCFSGLIGILAATDDYLAYIDFGESYAKGVEDSSIWNYYQSGGDGKINIVDGRVEFAANTNINNTSGNRSVLLADKTSDKKISSGGKYRIVFDVTASEDMFKNLSSQFIFANNNWGEISGAPVISDKLSALTLESKTEEKNNVIYTLSKTVDAPVLDANCNLLLSIYGEGGGSKYYLDNVYIYAAKEYKLYSENETFLGSIYGIPDGDISTDIKNSDFYKIGYGFTVSPEKYPQDINERITISYTPQNNLVSYVDFGSDYAKTDAQKYIPNDNTYVILDGKQIKFKPCEQSVDFTKRAVLLTNNCYENAVVSGNKYRLTLKLISSSAITEHNLEIKFGTSLTGDIDGNSALFDGNALSSGVKSQKKLSGGKMSYVVDLDMTVPGSGSKNLLVSFFSDKECSLDVAVIRRFFDYNVYEENGSFLGVVSGFSGDSVKTITTNPEYVREDYICEAVTEVFPDDPSENVVVKYSEITNILEYIDFGEDYAANHRAGEIPAWQYIGGDTSFVSFGDRQIIFDGQINSGKSYGDRAVLLTNDRNTVGIKAGRRYQLQFDLLLKGESLDSKSIDIRFGSQVWDAASYSVSKASELNLIKTEYSDPYTVYTLSVILVAPSNNNILLSVYGNGASPASILKNVYIYEEFGFNCIDENGDPVGTLYAFPGEDVTPLIKDSEIDRRGFFESVKNPLAPKKPSGKIKVHYEADPSFVSFIDFSSVYAATQTTRYVVSSSGSNINYITLDRSAENLNIAANNKTSDSNFRYRSFVLANDYLNSGLIPGKEYLITFDLTVNSGVDIRNFSFSFKSGRYASTGLSGSKEVIYTGADILENVLAENAVAGKKVYTVALAYTLDESGWGSYSERNILMSVFGGNSACIIDNIEIAYASRVVLNNTSLKDVVGRIGYDLILPKDPVKKNHTFVGWFADADYSVPFTAEKFTENTIQAYAYFKKVDTTAQMDFSATPPDSAKLYGFTFNQTDKNIYASTDETGLAYLNMYSNSNIIQMSPVNYYPVTFRYKTSGYTGNIKIYIVSASKNNFDTAKNILSVTTLTPSDDWKSGSICATPEILVEDGIKGDYLYFAVSYDKSAGGRVFIDDIVLTQETTVAFNTMGGETISEKTGEPGKEFTLPTPIKSGSEFTGWYYDKTLEYKVTGSKICYPTAKKKITLYASWDKSENAITSNSFENYTNEEINKSANDSEKQVFSISDNIAKTGNSSMRYIFDPQTVKSITPQRSTFKLKGNSGVGSNGITVEKGKTYVLSFYVYAKQIDTTVDFTAFTAKGDSVLKNGVKVAASGENARISPKFFPNYEWKKVYYVFKSAHSIDDADELYLSVRANSASVYTEIYIDDVCVEPLGSDMGAVAFNSSVYSANLVHMEYNYAVGKIGDPITLPKTHRENYALENWYIDYRYTKVIDGDFAEGVKPAYPQWNISGTVKVSFENAADYQQDGSGTSNPNKYTNQGGGQVVVNEQSSDGIAAYKYDGAVNRNWEKAIALKESDGSPLRLVDGNSYVILLDVYLERYGSDFSFNFCTASQDNYYAWRGSTTGSIIVNADTPTGVWITTALTISASFLQPGGFNLFMRHNASGGNTIVYFDNIRISSIDPAKPTIIINKGLIGGSVDVITGNIGESYTLPSEVKVDGYDFCGWYSSPALTRAVDPEGVFFETMTVYAKMLPKNYTNGFEASADQFKETNGGDIDYEIYDKNAPGNDPENVHSGDKSLHRKGMDYQHKNALIVRKNATLYPGEPYELSMWVKMDSYDHTNGAIKIASCSSRTFAWDLVGDMQAVIPISDLTDGNWHYVTYNFMASAYYLSLQTPGYCSIYIDDITVKHLKNAGISKEFSYNEYIPIKKNAEGRIPAIEEIIPEIIRDTSLLKYEEYQKLLDKYNELSDDYDWDESDDSSSDITRVKKKKTTVTQKRNPLTFKDILTGNSYAWYTIAFYSGVGGLVIIVAGTVLLIILLKKRKKKKMKISGGESNEK